MGSFRSVQLLDDSKYLLIQERADGTGYVAKAGDTMTGDLIGTDFVKTRSGTITRVGGLISQIAYAGGRTLNFTRVGGLISSITDGVRTWNFTRDINNYVSSWTVV